MKRGNGAKNHDGNQSRISFFLQQCAEMDAMPMEKRQEALSFAKAMTALEGLPAKEETEKNLQLWAKGEKRFVDFYMKTLQFYSIIDSNWMIQSEKQLHTYMEEGEKHYDSEF